MRRRHILVASTFLGCAVVCAAIARSPGPAEPASHWAFVVPSPPIVPLPRQPAWTRNPIDCFVLAELEQAGLTPAPEADRYTLARRLHLDLTGLPPTPADVDRFVTDPAPDAYERLVDRLLNDPAYGERWAGMWLDLARYADTRGYGTDKRRTIWRYRDWVIDAFNDDKPYDHFTVEQIAGDLLSRPRRDQLLATAFHRNTMNNDESNSGDEEYRVAAVKDRVDTTMQVWMGLTAGCANCHDHKYDPISQHDYYGLYAIFNQTQDNDRPDELPVAEFPTPEMDRLNAPVLARIAEVEAAMQKRDPELDRQQARWEHSAISNDPWMVLTPEQVWSDDADTTFTPQADGSVLVAGAAPFKDTYTFSARTNLGGIRAVRLEAMIDPSLPLGGPGRYHQTANVVLSGISLTVSDPRSPPNPRRVSFDDARGSTSNAADARKATDGNAITGWDTGEPYGVPHMAIFYATEPFGHEGGTHLRFKLEHLLSAGRMLGRFRLAITTQADADLDSTLPQEVVAILRTPAADRTERQRAALGAHYRSIAPTLAPMRQELEMLRQQLVPAPRIPIMQELPAEARRSNQLHVRGDYRNPGMSIEPALPALFGPHSTTPAPDRLALAQWLVQPSNPLTSRVAVNRHWARFFGTGLVETEEDFGTQGTVPSHPQLLDWLSLRLVQDRWSMKKLCRRIVTSATYRQSAATTSTKIQRDPRNRLLSRGGRYRLDAETLRDQGLAASGLLSRKLHGPSVMPVLPEGVWNLFSADRYRRALYTHVQRASPYPSMITFDAPPREVCTVRRIRSNTPLQALVTLNDPVFVEMARAMARRVLREAGPSPADQIHHAMRLAVARPPSDEELQVLLALYDRRLAEFQPIPRSPVCGWEMKAPVPPRLWRR
jgi:hypothetical protein